MDTSTNLQEEKLELMQLLLSTHDSEILKRIREVFESPQANSFELSRLQKEELDQRTQLRHDGQISTSSWDDVKARILRNSK